MLERADGIHVADADALENLSGALTLSGIAMGVAGRTAPCSGMEHTVSHLLEMTERPGSAARCTAPRSARSRCWRRCCGRACASRAGGGLHALRFPSAAEMEPRVRAAFAELDPSGRVGEACWRGYARKLERWNGARGGSPSCGALAGVRRRARRPARLPRAAGRRAARGARAGAADPARRAAERARWALAHGHLMRDRFTVADLAFFMGLWDDAGVDALLADAAPLGVGL